MITKAICNKGFSGISSVLPRIKFRVGGQDSSPQSLTAYSLNRYVLCRVTTLQTFTENIYESITRHQYNHPQRSQQDLQP